MPADAGKTIAALTALMGRVNVACEQAAQKSALAIQRAGMGKTRVRRGTLRRSWRVEPVASGGGVYAVKVGPTMVYARRIELGFHGADSLGRVYHQAGKPYVRPALVEMLPAVQAFAKAELTAALRA